MDEFTIVDNISQQFLRGEATNMIVRSRNVDIKAHRNILVQGSKHFRTLLEGNFTEANRTTVELHGDDPRAVTGLIAFFYGLHYDGTDTYTRKAKPVESQDISVDFIFYHVNLFIAADKYRVQTLVEHVRARFHDIVSACKNASLSRDDISTIAKYIWVDQEQAADDLQEFVVDMVWDRMVRDRRRNEDSVTKFEETFLSIPKLATEVLRAAIANREAELTGL